MGSAEPLPSPSLTLQPWANQGGEEQEEEEATSGLSEVPRPGSKARDTRGEGPELRRKGSSKGWHRGAGEKGNVVGARRKPIDRVVETIAIKRRLIKVKNEDCVTPKTNRK